MPNRALLLALGLIVFLPVALLSFGAGPGAGLIIGVVLMAGGLFAWYLGARGDA